MNISDIGSKTDETMLSMLITKLAICMDNIEGHTDRLESFMEDKTEVELNIKSLVEKWQK